MGNAAIDKGSSCSALPTPVVLLLPSCRSSLPILRHLVVPDAEAGELKFPDLRSIPLILERPPRVSLHNALLAHDGQVREPVGLGLEVLLCTRRDNPHSVRHPEHVKEGLLHVRSSLTFVGRPPRRALVQRPAEDGHDGVDSRRRDVDRTPAVAAEVSGQGRARVRVPVLEGPRGARGQGEDLNARESK